MPIAPMMALPMMGQPLMFQGMPYPETPMMALDRVKGVWVSQKAQYLESLGCCEFENKYRIYGTKSGSKGAKKDKNDKLFKARERSTCYQRYCIPYSLKY